VRWKFWEILTLKTWFWSNLKTPPYFLTSDSHLEEAVSDYYYDSDETILSQASPELYANKNLLSAENKEIKSSLESHPNSEKGELDCIEVNCQENSNNIGYNDINENTQNSNSLFSPLKENADFNSQKILPCTQSAKNFNLNLNKDENNFSLNKPENSQVAVFRRKPNKSEKKNVASRSSRREKNPFYQPFLEMDTAKSSYLPPWTYESENNNYEEKIIKQENDTHYKQMEEINIAESKLLTAKKLLSMQQCGKAESILEEDLARRIDKLKENILNNSESYSLDKYNNLEDSQSDSLVKVRQSRVDELIENVEILKTQIYQSYVVDEKVCKFSS